MDDRDAVKLMVRVDGYGELEVSVAPAKIYR
jgi:hypothetical protein